MNDPQSVAERYLAAWNETDAPARRRLLAEHWSADAHYADPLMQGSGHDAIDALIAGVQQRFPGFRFVLRGRPDGHGDCVRFGWSLGPAGAPAPIEGTDVVRLAGGRLHSVVGFLDKVPAG